MKTMQVDVAIMGAGTAGLAAYRAARTMGASVVSIEDGEYGTTCARVGCMPSKLLIAAADAAHAVARASGFGVGTGPVAIDGRKVMERVRRERDRFVGFVLSGVNAMPESERLRGRARFVDDRTLEVDDHTRVVARSIVMATGARATGLRDFSNLGERLVINDDVFNWDDLPASVAVVGPGIIGLELGQALHRLGVRISVLGRGGRVGPISDPVVRDNALAIFGSEFRLEVAARMSKPERDGGGVIVRLGGPEGSLREEHFDYLLAATGRAPDMQDIGLDRTSLSLDGKGVPAFDPSTTRTVSTEGASPVFLAGDASNFIPLLHEAVDEGRIAGTNAARHAQGKPVQPERRRAALSIAFTDPQMAVVGGGFRKQVRGSFVTGQAGFEDQGRARILRRNTGLLRVYGDPISGRFLGAEMIAPEGEHLAHLLAWALQKGMTVAEMLEMPFYHPVIEEGVRTALRDLLRRIQGHGT